MIKTRERKLIERSLIFSITLIGVLFFMIFDLFFVYTYRIDGFRDMQWLAFWTHLSNLLALTWITLALISVSTNSQKLEDKINHWNVKNTIYTFIITTGVAFMIFAYIPVVIAYARPGNIAEIENLVLTVAYNGQLQESWWGLIGDNGKVGISNELQLFWEMEANRLGTMFETEKVYHLMNGKEIIIDPTLGYRICVIVGTTFKHLIIPGMFIYLGVTEIGYTKTKGMSDYKRSMIQFAWPSMYLVYALTISSMGLVNPPYPVVNIGFTYAFYDRTIEAQYLSSIVYVMADLGMGALFVITSLIQNMWNTNRIECEKSKREDETGLTNISAHAA